MKRPATRFGGRSGAPAARARSLVRAGALSGLAALTLFLVACGEREERLRPDDNERFELVLDSAPNVDHAPIYAARSGGHFADVGLDLRIRPARDPAEAIAQVAAGRADLAISTAPAVIGARGRGVGVTAVGALIQEPLASIIALPAGRIRTPVDLDGARVGTEGLDYQTAYLRTVLDDADLPADAARVRDVGSRLIPALLDRRVDAVLGAYWNREGLELRLRRRRPSVIRIDEAGVPPYDELVLVANADALERAGGGVRAFVAALSRGELDLRRNPDRTLRALRADNPVLDPRLARDSLRVTAPLFTPARGRPYGWQEPGEWEGFTDWMRQSGLIGELDPRAAFTNDYLPGRGLRR